MKKCVCVCVCVCVGVCVRARARTQLNHFTVEVNIVNQLYFSKINIFLNLVSYILKVNKTDMA